MKNEEEFDHKLVGECAKAFALSTGLGCTVSQKDGSVLEEYGYGCKSCRMCRLIKLPPAKCVESQIYGMSEAERFGGKYIYFCPMGFTCFVSPILGSGGSAAKITVGPILMVDKADYIECDLRQFLNLSEEQIEVIQEELPKVPTVNPDQVTGLSMLLFLAVGFLNNVSESNRMLDRQDSDAIQGQITSYIQQLKGESQVQPYPFDTEKALLSAISQDDKPEANRLLNEIFGH
ncbi:MAG: PocR ligand-binding domain-containing protein, partial [Oscillospiraceae bacterium]